MLRKLIIVCVAMLAAVACNKHDDDPPGKKQDVVFVGLDAPDGKALLAGCDNPQADYARVVIEGNIYLPKVFYIGGTPYTEAIKLLPGSYVVTEFMLMYDAGTPGLLHDDVIVQAIPAAGSDYAPFVSNPVSFSIGVSLFDKTEIAVDVICFNETDFDKFGFDWFSMTEVAVRSQYFYGTLATGHPDEYAGSLYESQAGGLQNQMPAIFKIDVYRNDAWLISYDNESWLGEGDALQVLYPDLNNASDRFDFEMSVLVKSCDGFNYEMVKKWSFTDDEQLNTGSDNVVDFEMGDCQSQSDYQIPAWLTLPGLVQFDVLSYGLISSHGTMVDFELQNVPESYLVSNGVYPGWSAEHSMNCYEAIFSDVVYANVYSSLCADLLPDAIKPDKKNWQAANWLMNNLGQYPGYEWDDIQGALWLILDKVPEWDGSTLMGVRALSELQFAQQMHDDAIHEGVEFFPQTGDVYALVFVNSDDTGRSEKPVVHIQFVSYNQ